MVITRPIRSRPTLFWWLTPFKKDADPEPHLFWVVTALVSAWLLSTVLVDIVLHWRVIIADPLELWATIIGAGLATTFCVLPLALRLRFPRWCAVVGYFAALVLLANNIFYVGNAVLATTALHILPVLGMYLGWFWEYRQSVFMFAISVALILTATSWSPLVGDGKLLTYVMAVFTVFIMTVTFSLAAFLSRAMATTASTDSLTGVLNMRGIRLRLAQEMARARRRTEALVVAITDFDGFKHLNDTHGHSYGDEVLRTNSARWVEDLRVYDVVGRLGGDEFVLIFPRTRAAQAANVLRRLHAISTHEWSWGIAQQRPDDTVESIIARADERLYEKKHEVHGRAQLDERESPGDFSEARLALAQRPRPRRPRYHQSAFSVLSASLGLLLLIPLSVGLAAGEMPPLAESPWVIGAAWFVGFAVFVISLAWGDRLSPSMAMWLSASLIFVYINMALILESLVRGIGILYAFSAIALYLGTFEGSNRSRILLYGALTAVSAPILTLAFSKDDDVAHAVSVTAVVYAFSVCFVLFELSSYLYNRSRILVEHDALTGVLNRYGLREYGEAEISRAERGGYPLTAVMLDCVGFKHINDTQGHQAGNRLLADLATHLRSRIAPDDVLVRMGGDEFLLLVPYMSERRAREHVAVLLADAPIRMHVGVAELRAEDTLESLIDRADQELSVN